MSEQVIKRLGEGTFGVVEEVVYNGERVARKTYNRVLCPSAIREVTALQSISHPNIIRLRHVDFTISHTISYLELADNSLCEYMTKSTTLGTIAQMIHGVLCALQVLHSRDLVHGDVTPFNILVVQGVAKLADFGTFQRSRTGARTTNIPWSAPEYLLQEHHSPATDIWAIGVILYSWIRAEDLWSWNISEDMLLDKQIDLCGCPTTGLLREYMLPRHRSQPDRKVQPMEHSCYSILSTADKYHWEELIRGCLSIEPAYRWTANQALASPLFTNYTCPIPVWHIPPIPRTIKEIYSLIIKEVEVTVIQKEVGQFLAEVLYGLTPSTPVDPRPTLVVLRDTTSINLFRPSNNMI